MYEQTQPKTYEQTQPVKTEQTQPEIRLQTPSDIKNGLSDAENAYYSGGRRATAAKLEQLASQMRSDIDGPSVPFEE